MKNEAQVKTMTKILPKLQAFNPKIVLLPWSVYYKNQNTKGTKRKVDCISSKSDVDMPITKDECIVEQTPEKVPRISKG